MSEEKVDIAKIINPNLIKLNLKAITKKEVINELSDLLKLDNDIDNKQVFVKDVFKRETEGETGIGQGVAIPHGKSTAVKNTTIAIGLSNHPIPWETLDDQPVTAVILFAVRDQDASTLHLKLLQQVAILLSDDDFIDKLHHAKTKEKVIQLLCNK
ncbi:PTS sugar transporter subunit IIA [Lactobacillus panisapium]|uniref:PTS sugar transporter subunit IIA n=1 Tax=Lactobacillus panisapium TaxID=2012495 RepID=UPI001C6A0F0F|nr:PTS sugar transporter subunit IIA [Lactobacillus panisapium]QYN56924.1 PTS sugar transporter subunit IIA [Lactobacillus panisapium]